MKKKLPINLDVGISIECWTFYRLSILLKEEKNYAWYLRHLNHYYLDNDLQFTFDIDNNMVSYYDDVMHIVEADSRNLIKNIIDGINNNNYFFVYVDRFYIKGDPFFSKQRYLHEILIYGYDMEEQHFMYIDMNNKKGTYEKYLISFEDLNQAHLAWVDEFNTESRQDRWVNNFLSVHGLYPANKIILRSDIDQDLKLHLFLKDIVTLLNGNSYQDTRKQEFKYTGIEVYEGYKEKLLNKLLINPNYLHEGNDINRGKSNFWILAHFKGMYEVKKELKEKLLYINLKTETEIFSEQLIKRIDNVYFDLKLVFELLWKFYFSSDKELLNKIVTNLDVIKGKDVAILNEIKNILIEFLKKNCEKKYSF